MIKKSIEKMLICILIFIVLFNFLLTSVTYADNTTNTTNSVTASTSAEETEAKHNERLEESNSGLGGIILSIIRTFMCIPGMIINIETYAVANSAGVNDTNQIASLITPFDIIFNRFILTDINVFTLDGLNPNGMVATIRKSVAAFFAITSGVAIGLLIVIGLIITIKMALAKQESAEEESVLKKALPDFLFSIGLVLFMDVIVILMVNVNNMFVNGIKGVASHDISASVTAIEDIITSSSTGLLLGFGAVFVYLALAIITLLFLIKYIRRFFKVILLIIIAPLAPVPYAVSRMTGNRSGTALRVWFNEMVDAIFMQIIHCIVYVCIVGVALEGFAAETEIKGLAALAPCTFAIFAMLFVWPAETLIRKIFGIQNTGTSARNVIRNIASGAREVSSTMSSIQNIQSTGTSIIGGIMNNTNSNSNTNTNNTYNNGMPGAPGTQGIGDTTVHTKPITGGDSSLLIEGGEGLASTGASYNPNMMDASDMAFIGAMTSGQGLPSGDDSVPMALSTGDTDKIAEVIAGLNLPDSNETDTTVTETTETTEIIETTETIHEVDEVDEGDGDVEIPIATNPDKEHEDAEITRTINEKLEEIHKKLQEQLSEILDSNKIKELETQIVQMVKEKLEGVDDPSSEEIKQVISEVQEELKAQIATGDAERDNEIAEALKGFTTISALAVSQGYDVDVDPKAGEVIDAEVVDSVDVPADAVDGVVDETTGFIRDAVANELALVPATKDLAVDVATKNAIFTGEIDGEFDMSDTNLSEIVSRLATRSSSDYGDNFDKALRKAQKEVEREGEAEMAKMDAFRNNPSAEAYAQLSKAGQTVAQIENMAAARGIAVQATQNAMSAEQYTQATKTKITHTQSSSDVLAQLQAQKPGDQGNT